MARKKFLKNKPFKTAGGVVVMSVVRGGGTVAAAYVTNKVVPMVPQIPAKVAVFIPLAIGLAGEVFIQNEYVKCFAEGMTAYGILHLLGVFAPGMKAEFGLAGIGFTGSQSTVHEGNRLTTVEEAMLNEELEMLEGMTDASSLPGGRSYYQQAATRSFIPAVN